MTRCAQPSDWQTHEMPRLRTTVALDRLFSSEEMERIRCGLVPEEMEDKWFIYWLHGALYFHRSWTGNCTYVVRFRAAEEAWRMISAEVNRDAAQYKETRDERDVAMISYLIDILLLDRGAEFPSDESDSGDRALANWSQVGRAMVGDGPGVGADGGASS